jgi:hypothetical protein
MSRWRGALQIATTPNHAQSRVTNNPCVRLNQDFTVHVPIVCPFRCEPAASIPYDGQWRGAQSGAVVFTRATQFAYNSGRQKCTSKKRWRELRRRNRARLGPKMFLSGQFSTAPAWRMVRYLISLRVREVEFDSLVVLPTSRYIARTPLLLTAFREMLSSKAPQSTRRASLCCA